MNPSPQQHPGTGPRLAVFGCTPAFAEARHVGRPNLGNRDRFLARLNDILDRRWLTNRGEYVIELEKRIAELVGVRNCILVCNGTVGLELLIRALDLRGEVIVPAFTFVATAHALQWQEITPVFADINPATHCLDPASVESMITPQLMEVLHAENVIARRYFYPGVHRMEPYKSYFPHAHLLLPRTEQVCRQVLVLPTGTSVSEADIARICEVIRIALDHAAPVRKRLGEIRAAAF